MSDIPLKHCNKCGDLPATTEFFFQCYLKPGGKNICKACHKVYHRGKGESFGARLKEIAQFIQKDEMPSYQTLNAVARSIGTTPTKVEHDVYESKLPVFKFIYNNVGPALALKLEDAKSYIATHSLNGHTSSGQITEPIEQITEPVIIEEPPIDIHDQCDACGNTRGNIFGDIDKTTHERYGYLCTKCHQLVSEYQRNPMRLHNVFEYIEKTRGSRV